ncbi:arginine-hydroxylase NDUFAF5, mitochondrial isoform X2 [Arctopsyche grandis]|uniref:arginine-hydroxylase NDUFAF5, mitochondrial isoform X2 n=1 Tax=Arctopsyche grandis TaxID=121162 RepID=UPI00406D6480
MFGVSRVCLRSLSSLSGNVGSGAAGPQVFDSAAKRRQRLRAAADPESLGVNYLHKEVGWRLADRVFDIKKNFDQVADIGCNRGYVAKHLTPDCIKKLIVCDSNQDNLDKVELPEGIEIEKRLLDEEKIDLPANSLDMVISSLCLHWVNDLPGCFDNIMKSLKNDGVFLATMFGEDTLFELRSSLQLADLERNGGIAPHISPFTRIRDIGGLLNRSGFTLQTIDTDEITVGYPSMFELMWDLQLMGENNASYNRQLHLSRSTQMAAAAIYDELYGKTKMKSVPATYQIIYLLGWKPDKSQPKVLKRGTGEVSLKDLHRLDKIAKELGNVDLSSENKPK